MKLLRLAWLIGIFAFAGFGSGCNIAKDYVAADRATFDAIAPEYRSYIESDPKLDEEQKARRRRTIDSWKLRLDSVK